MSSLRPNRFTNETLEPKQLSPGGSYPDASIGIKVAQAANSCVAFKRKAVFWSDTIVVPNAAGSTYHFNFYSSPAPNSARLKLRMEAIVGDTNNISAVDPRLYFTVNGTSSEITHVNAIDPTESLSIVNSVDRWRPVATELTIPGDTELTGTFVVMDSIRVMSVVIYEHCEPSLAIGEEDVSDHRQFQIGTTVTDDQYQQLTRNTENIFKYNAPEVLGTFWTASENPFAIAASTSFRNPLDNSTTVSGTSKGWIVNLANRAPLSNTDNTLRLRIAYKLAATPSAGPPGNYGTRLALKTDTQTPIIDIAAIKDTQWHVTYASVSGTIFKIDPYMAVSGTGGGASGGATLASLYIQMLEE